IQTPLPVLAGVLHSTGLIAILQGLAAEVSIRTYHESQRKPTYTVRRRLNLEPPGSQRRLSE
ncbi:MAG: glycosyltransferase, partial [Chloroflexi bacterium]|nr:glycosyltransferase [Chloroflexota bacterium]